MKTHYILNQGFGVQTTYLYLQAMEGLIPVDYAINADVGDESVATYKHAAWMKTLNGPPIVIRSAGKISEDLKTGKNSTGQRFASIPAYTTNRDFADEAIVKLATAKTAKQIRAIMAEFSETVSPPGVDESEVELFDEETKAIAHDLQERWSGHCKRKDVAYLTNQIHLWTQYGQVKRQCTKEYKTSVVEAWIRHELLGLEPGQRIPKGTHVVQYIGISMDEIGRAIRIKKRFESMPWAEVRFPLVEMKKTRDGCAKWLWEKHRIVAPRSACVHCPYHDDIEWLRVKAVPEDWALACEVDDALRTAGNIVNRGARQKMYLHRSCIPLRDIDFTKPSRPTVWQRGLFQECEGMCGN